ncbi:extracellular solute-binding protein [Hoeflea sp. YIM 152468]|uniref:extracellular solute-binding protein n=1 Tax=Hoeflea sp. YIM 152468 TaxID=3031759 RepID=UPI0023DC8484|nr:extracellular solute-binding protein [Hoeflea sp. YIM 152468]MDF1607453.1 extracellular solute-binding protein [Hoeflea sp. YIM 152468]
MKFLGTKLLATAAVFLSVSGGASKAETLRLLTWGSYAPDEVIKLFEAEYPDITVEPTFSNNEEMIAKLRATGGSGFDLAQPGFNRVAAAQDEYDIYKPIDLSRINTEALRPDFLEQVKRVAAVDGVVYSVPHMWGTSGLIVDKSQAPEINDWLDLCDAKYEGKTSMRLKRSILVGTAFALGHNPYEAYADLDAYQTILDEVGEKLIACKSVIKTYWTGGDDLSNLMLSGEVVASDTWDSTAFKLNQQKPDLVYVPPKSGTLGWIDTFTLPRKGEADDAAYKWINFLLRPEIIPLISASTGSIVATKNGIELLPGDMKTIVENSFTEEDLANIKFAAQILPGVEDIEGHLLERIKAAN